MSKLSPTDPPNILGRNYPTSVVPTTMVLDRQHKVATVFRVALLAENIRPLLDRLTTER